MTGLLQVIKKVCNTVARLAILTQITSGMDRQTGRTNSCSIYFKNTSKITTVQPSSYMATIHTSGLRYSSHLCVL